MQILFILCMFFSCAIAQASFDFTPIIVSLAPVGPGASFSFTVKNGEEKKLPVQISIVHRAPDAFGKEEYKETPDIDDLFQIYPAQLVLGPKEKRAVRVTWMGDPKLSKELAYRIIAEELPFAIEPENKSMKKASASFQMSTRYIGSLYVTPPGAKSVLEMVASPSKDPKPQLALEVENKGSLHKLLTGLKLTVSAPAGNPSFTYTEQALVSVAKENVLAGKKRSFRLDWPAGVPVGPVKVTFELPGD